MSESSARRAVQTALTSAAADTITAELARECKLKSPRDAYFQLGLQLLFSGRAASAAEAFEMAAKEEGSSPSAAVTAMALGQASAYIGADDRALRAFLHAALDLPSMFAPLMDAAFGVLRADSAVIQRHWLEEAWFEKATHTSLAPPERGLVQAFIGAAMLMVGDSPRAFEHFSAIPRDERSATWQAVVARVGSLDLPPAVADGEGGRAFLLARIAEALGQTEASLDYLDRALEIGFPNVSRYPDAPAHALRGKLLVQLGRKTEAVDSYVAAANRYLWRNEAPEAVAYIERALALNERSADVHWRLAEALLRRSYAVELSEVEGIIRRSLDVWNCGINLAPPDDETRGWPYLTRAIIAQRLAELPGADRWEHYWETIAFVEQALLLDPNRTYSWVTLGRMHNMLRNDLQAWHATETALLCGPEDVDAVEQCITLLTNLRSYDKVWPLLTKRRTMEPHVPGWLNAVEAHIALYEIPPDDGDPDAYKAALAASDAACASGWDAPWSSIDRARLLHLVGRTEEARHEYEMLWGKFVQHERDIDDQPFYAWAALMQGKEEGTHKAFNIFGERAGDRVSGLSEMKRCLGFCRLLLDELASARDYFDQAIELADSARELDAWLIADFETREVLQLLAGRPHAEEARTMLEQCTASAKAKRAALQCPSSAAQEVQRLITALEARNETTCWCWIGAQAAAARLKLEAQCWREAEKIYRKLGDYRERFYAAQHGLAQALYGLVTDERGAAATLGAALDADAYESILNSAASALPEDHTRLADTHDERISLECRRRQLNSLDEQACNGFQP